MIRVAIRGQIVVLALVLTIASAGTVLCEMDCVAGGRTEAATAMRDSASGVATSHCDGEQMDSARQDMPARHGSSDGNTKHSGGHSHPRILATPGAKLQLSRALTLSSFAVIPISSGPASLGNVAGNSWNNSTSPPLKSPSAFSTGVLRI
jgi:hypothetical protein